MAARFITSSAVETEGLACRLALFLPQGAILALYGDLAAGKTCFVRGLARHFAGEEVIHSPTFTLVNEYGTGVKLYHLDLYRLSGKQELLDLGYEELFDTEHVCAVEWAERAEDLLPERHVEVRIKHLQGDMRQIDIIDPHKILGEGWAQDLGTGNWC